MENQENNQPEEEIVNIDQFQVGRSEGTAADGHSPAESDEYTPEEVEYADGEGTRLNDQLGPDDEEDDEDSDSDLDEDDEYNQSDIEELDNDPNAYEKDDSEML